MKREMKLRTLTKMAMAALIAISLIGLQTTSGFALTLVDYSVWQTQGREILDFNTIPNGTYLSAEFFEEGVLFGNHYGYTSVSDDRLLPHKLPESLHFLKISI